MQRMNEINGRLQKMRVNLNIYKENEQIGQYTIEPGQTTTIGRHPECNLTFRDSKISAHHCVIEPKNNYYYIVDQNSTNGTFVNDRRIRVRRLYNHDVITCGSIAIHFEWEEDDSSSSDQDVNLVEIANEHEESSIQPLNLDENSQIGDYRIIKKIGQGGIGEVFLTEHIARPGFPVAIKILTPSAQQNTTLVERFIREAKACITLEHPRIIKVFEIGIHNKRPFFAMEYIEGKTLDQYLKAHGSIPYRSALKIAGHIALGLAYAHAHHIIHRDLKPGNIMLENANHNVKIIDFGLAKMLDESTLTMTHHLVGTPRYMAPEQMKRSRDIDERVDIYSLGAILYHMIGGLAPYAEILCNNRIALLKYMYTTPPLRLNELPSYSQSQMPSSVIRIVDKAMAKKPQDRFSSAKDMYNAIYSILRK